MGTSLKEMEAIKQRHGEFYGEWLKLESPLHPVVIAKPFAMGRFAVTFDEWEVFARITGRKMPDDERWGRGRRPVINVSWNDASAYVEWLGETTGRPYRLPTEAEWEYGCRAGTTTAYSIGATITREQALFSPGYDSAEDRTVVVGTFRCNGWGLFDMHGNVWEWCQDQWHHNYDGAPDNGLAWQEKSKGGRRVVRGGAWSSKPENLRAANRDGDLAVDFSSSLGIRVARSLTS